MYGSGNGPVEVHRRALEAQALQPYLFCCRLEPQREVGVDTGQSVKSMPNSKI
jgi:hypothetical protein